MTESTLYPFSKPISGRWCRCEYARLSERCVGKMVCTRASVYLERCLALAGSFKERARFVAGV